MADGTRRIEAVDESHRSALSCTRAIHRIGNEIEGIAKKVLDQGWNTLRVPEETARKRAGWDPETSGAGRVA